MAKPVICFNGDMKRP